MAVVGSSSFASVPTTWMRVSRSLLSSSSRKALPPLPRRTRLVVRAEGRQRGGGDHMDLLEKTKVQLTKDDVLRNQEQNESEKKSVFGATPKSGSLYPRAEVERRPETGDMTFSSLMAFDGAGPETINGRLAMVGIFWAIIAEVATGKSVQQQLSSPCSTGLFWYLAAVQLLAYASLVPMFQGESPDSRRFGIFIAMAERWNGWLAMIGFLSLVVVEALRGDQALFHWSPEFKLLVDRSSVNIERLAKQILYQHFVAK